MTRFSRPAEAIPDVKYLVLVGDDRIIPFARITDGTGLLSESSVLVQELSFSTTTVGQALTGKADPFRRPASRLQRR